MGGLTNNGKSRLYDVGRILRNRYGGFLGDLWFPDLIESISTNDDRTKMSLELVLAGLFPPNSSNQWNKELNWQPIPFQSLSVEPNFMMAVQCPNYLEAYKEVLNELDFLYDSNKEMFDFISEKTGKKIKGLEDTLDVYMNFLIKEDLGIPLPDWCSSAYLSFLKNISLTQNYAVNFNNSIAKISIGSFWNKIIQDTVMKISYNSTIESRKMFLYSGHDTNVANFLINLGQTFDDYPPYGAALMIEVHNVSEVYGFKFYYQQSTTEDAQLLNVTGCGIFCVLEKFNSILNETITDDFDGVCGQ